MRYVITCLIVGACVFAGRGQNQTPILERKVSITATNEKVSVTLTRLGQLGGFSFSYNTALISAQETVTLDLKDRSVREILNVIFRGRLNYKERGNHLILTRAPAPKAEPPATVFIISGYVEDDESGARLPDASVYDRTTLASSITNEFGYYKIKLENQRKPVSLSVSKKNYRDTLVMISVPGNQFVNIGIRPLGTDSITVTATIESDSVQKEEIVQFPYESDANVQNIRDTLYREVQLSIVPFVGTNGQLSGNVINDYSFNFLGGYSLGTRKFELGLFANADRGDVSWLQIAGLANGVGGKFYGIQVAGFANTNRGETRAVQLAGFANTNLSNATGVQVAGFANSNIARADGVLIAGFSNFVNRESKGIDKSKYWRKKSKGVEIAGFANVQIGDYVGSQIAGGTNFAGRSLNGSQIAGIFNYGHKVRGTQLGLFNFADSLGGVPIGLISFVGHGYHKIEISADEIFYTNLAFRTGVRKFYNIVTAGMKPDKAFGTNDAVWSFGYGLGTAPRLARWLDLNIDLTSNHISKGGFTSELSLLNKIYLGFDLKFSRKLSLTFGGTLNGYLTKTTYTDYPIIFTDYTPHIFYDHNFNNNVNLKMWWGLKVGLRFL